MTDQPLSEISTSRLLDEVVSRSGGLTKMRRRLQDAVAGAILAGQPADFLKDEPSKKQEETNEIPSDV